MYNFRDRRQNLRRTDELLVDREDARQNRIEL